MKLIPVLYCLLLSIIWTAGIIRYKSLTIVFRIITWSVLVTLILAVLSTIFAIKYKNNAPILQLECITEYIFYALAYYYLFKNVIIKRVIIASLLAIITLFIINALFFQPFNKVFPSHVTIPALGLYVIFSLLLFKEMLQYPLESNIINQSIFWFNTAILFYSTTMFLNFSLPNYFVERKFYDIIIYDFWYFILFVLNILIGISIFIDKKETSVKNV